MRKKGGMELSINAIVILIIAMVVLGIGILFIRGMFGKAQTTTFKALTAQETTVPASADRPLVADKELTVSTSQRSATLQVSIYNKATSAAEGVTLDVTRCVDSAAKDVEDFGFTTITGITIQAGQFSSYQTVFSVGDSANAGDVYSCFLEAKGETIDESTTFIVKVGSG